MKNESGWLFIHLSNILLIHYCHITGIEYMLEFVREDDPDDVYYVCEMCKCRLSSGSVMAHLTGSRHGVAYVVSDK